MHRALASCELDVDPDVIYVKDGKLGEVKKRKDGTETTPAETALYSRWTTQRGSITGVKPFVRNGRGRASPSILFTGKRPVEIFDHIITPSTTSSLVHTVEKTNRRIETQQLRVEPTSIRELRVFVGLILFMAVVKVPQEHFYWRPHLIRVFSSPNFTEKMRYRRFQQPKKHLVFEESEVDEETTKKDNAWRVRAIFCLLKKMFNDCLPAPGEHLSIDEGMGRFFGRVTGLKKHMPNKPIKEGFKFFVAVDYDSGVCFDINMADGNPIDLIDDTEAGTTGHYIMELLKTLPGEGYKGYCDNFYSSPALFVEGKMKYGIYLVGTIRADRGVHPDIVLQSKKPTKNVQRVLSGILTVWIALFTCMA
jgi:hypothetical protein